MTRTKAEDEIFCFSCGASIKKEAVICPNCGVQNNAASSSNVGQSSVQTATVSDTWWYGVFVATIGWLLVIFWAVADLPGDALLGLLTVVVWTLLPVAAYFDIQYIRANSDWKPTTFIWVIAMAVWFINIIVGALYLYRRHEVLGEP